MIIAVIVMDLHVPESGSLKSKRFVIKSLKERLRGKFNVSVSEEANDLWQRVMLYVVSVTNDKQRANGVLDNVKNMVEREPQVEMLDYKMEFL